MKFIYLFILLAVYVNGNCQSARQKHKKANHAKTAKANTDKKALNNQIYDTSQVIQPRESITERYLNGDSGRHANAATLQSTAGKSPFATGVHAAANAGEKFDTAGTNINPNNVNNAANINTSVVNDNDTVYNANTITDNGMTTNSGAVDRSGQAQFGQSNWGSSRSTIGESQWTVPPPVKTSFTKEFPGAGNLKWSRNNTDTSIYSARYKSGDRWVTTNYSTSGQRLDTRTEVPLTLLPQNVSAYISKMPSDLTVVTITKWQVLGKSDVYEIQTKTGKIIYVNDDGEEVNR